MSGDGSLELSIMALVGMIMFLSWATGSAINGIRKRLDALEASADPQDSKGER